MEIDIDGNWAVRGRLDEVTSVSMWRTRDFYASLESEEIESMLQEAYAKNDYVENVPEDAFSGLSKADDQIYWFTAEQMGWIVNSLKDEVDPNGYLENYETIDKGMDWETGALTLKGETIVAINGDSQPDDPPAVPSEGTAVSTSENVVVALAVAGTAATVTGIYFYAHPEKAEEVKEFFANISVNVRDLAADTKAWFLSLLPGYEKEQAELITEPAVPAA